MVVDLPSCRWVRVPPFGLERAVLHRPLDPCRGSAVLVTLTHRKRWAEVITARLRHAGGAPDLGSGGRGNLGGQFSAFGGFLYLDAFGALVLIPIAGVGFVAALYSINYMGRQYERGMVDDRHIVRYYQGFNGFMLTMLLVPLANNMGLMWVAIEATTLVSVFMIMLYTNQGAIEAAWKYLIDRHGGAVPRPARDSPLLLRQHLGIPLGGSADGLDEHGRRRRTPRPGDRQGCLRLRPRGPRNQGGPRADAHVAPRRPRRGPDARQRAALGRPPELRHLRRPEVQHRSLRHAGTGIPSELLILLGLLSMGIAAASIYFQKDMKRMLAYSSVEHMGIVSLAVGFGGFIGTLRRPAPHNEPRHRKAPDVLRERHGEPEVRDEGRWRRSRGIIKVMPVTGAMPPGRGPGDSRDAAVQHIPERVPRDGVGIRERDSSSQPPLMILLLVVVFAGFLRHLVPMVFGSPSRREGGPLAERGRETDGMGVLAVVPMAILVALVVVLGFYIPQPLQTLIRDAVQVFGQGAPSQ